MTERADDPTVWVGYADLMTTLAVLFFVLFAVAAARARVGPALLLGHVHDARTDAPLSGCTVRLGIGRQLSTDADGTFAFPLRELRTTAQVDVGAMCPGYGSYAGAARVAPGDTTLLPIILRPLAPSAPDSGISVITVPGDALFARNDYTLYRDGVDSLQRIGMALRRRLGAGQVVAVVGHTDDKPFPAGSSKDNWVLSAERAASAARVLTDPKFKVGLLECQVLIIGFGPSRPRKGLEVRPSDPVAVREHKRKQNRRIEFRIMEGSEVSGDECATR
jgi:flagellar motor protein MotB